MLGDSSCRIQLGTKGNGKNIAGGCCYLPSHLGGEGLSQVSLDQNTHCLITRGSLHQGGGGGGYSQ